MQLMYSSPSDRVLRDDRHPGGRSEDPTIEPSRFDLFVMGYAAGSLTGGALTALCLYAAGFGQ